METSFEDGFAENDRRLSQQQRPQFYEKMKGISVSIFMVPVEVLSQASYDTTNAETASGFLISKNGHILTCSHVVQGDDRGFLVQLAHDDHFRIAMVVHDEPASDVAVLQLQFLEGEGEYGYHDFCKFGNEGHIHMGMDVFSISNADGFGFSFLRGQVSLPCVLFGDTQAGGNKLFRHAEDVPLIRVSNLHAYEGASGGPLFDWKGRVIGMISFGLTDGVTEVADYPIHIRRLREICQRLKLIKESKKRKGTTE